MITVVPFVLEGGPLSHSDTDGNTMLHAAASGWQERMVEFLILAGAAVNAQNKDGDTALHLVTDSASPTPGPLTKSERSPEEARRSTFTRLFVGGADLTARNNRGHIPLHVAALRGDILALENLLAADPGHMDLPGPTGATSLALAISKGYVECTRMLIRAGADPHLDIRDGIRPLDLLEMSDNPDMQALSKLVT
jgi:ankyrin repeat protein